MKMTEEKLLRLARLAALDVRPEEVPELLAGLEEMAGFLDLLPEMDETAASESGLALVSESAEPQDRPLDRQSLLSAAPHTDGEYYLVPRTAE
ncbi:MAG: hypothetical protein IJD21_03390 [Oscillospiraceae bacterium]|nr:hypothetical protein [Oscillospiraceae bacterium]